MPERKSPVQPVAISLVLAAAALRLFPHPPNFTPVGGIALFGGARLKGWQAYVIPLLAMLITDPILSHMAGYPAYSKATLVIYGSFLIYVMLGRFLLKDRTGPALIVGASVFGSIQFFLVTNFFVWWGSGSMYAHNFAGLTACYAAALPFLSRTLAGDLFYTAALFAGYSLLTRRLDQNSRNHAVLR